MLIFVKKKSLHLFSLKAMRIEAVTGASVRYGHHVKENGGLYSLSELNTLLYLSSSTPKLHVVI